MSTIQVLKPKFHIDECLEQVRECLEKGWTGSGFKTAELETKWKEYTGHENACFLNSNTSGLHLAVNILKRHGGWHDGDEIISTPITFVATNHAILYENMKPVFADVDEYLCMDPADVEKKITDKTRAVIFVGYGAWDLLQPQDATSRHRGAKPPRRCELLGEISLLSPR